jgi:hypothetical protein
MLLKLAVIMPTQEVLVSIIVAATISTFVQLKTHDVFSNKERISL